MDEPVSFIQDFGQGPALGPACSRTGDTAQSKADPALVALTLGAGDSPQTGECPGQCRLVTNSMKNLDRGGVGQVGDFRSTVTGPLGGDMCSEVRGQA